MKNKFDDFLKIEKEKEYFKEILNKIAIEEKNHVIVPKLSERFKALQFFEPEETRVIIIGQDPYYLENQADGLAFSTTLNKTPKSLFNMMIEIKKDYPDTIFETNSLDYWALQGVLLINSSLSVNLNYPNSHANFGWDKFVKNLIKYIISFNKKVVFGILGNNAKKIIDSLVINWDNVVFSAHPSPLSYYRGFKDSHFFKRINDKLDKKIDFSIRKVEKC